MKTKQKNINPLKVTFAFYIFMILCALFTAYSTNFVRLSRKMLIIIEIKKRKQIARFKY